MPVEITSRIRRDELLQILETEAPVSNQRTTAPMPAVTLTDLLCLREEELSLAPADDRLAEPPPPPARRMRANTVPAPSRSPVRAVGTDTQLKALAPSAVAPTAVAPSAVAAEAPAVSRTSTFDTPALIVDRAPLDLFAPDEPAAGVVAGRAPTADTAPIAAVSLEQAARELALLITPDVPAPGPVRPPNVFGVPIMHPPCAMRVSHAYELPPLDAGEIADVVDRFQELDAGAPEAPVAPVPVFAISFASAPVPAPALTTQQLSLVSLRALRPLVIAASCLVTLVLALLISLL